MDWNFDWDDVADVFKTDGKISFWKVMGGAAAGVATVVALPIAGGVGAITATGAAVASAVGGAVGLAASYMDDSEQQAEHKGEQRGEAKTTAKYTQSFEKLKEGLRAEINKRHSNENYFDLIVAMHAVGMACAACDGDVSQEERRDIEEFIGGLAMQKLPDHVQAKLTELATNPPSLSTAFELVKQYGTDATDLFDEVIELVIRSDGHVAPQEERFRAQWAILKAAA